MVKEIRDAIAVIVEAVSGLSEWPGGEDEIPGLGSFFRVRPAGIPGFQRAGRSAVDGEIPFTLTLRYQTVPDEPTRLGEAMDSVEAVRTALDADIDDTVPARLSIEDAVPDYGTPGYVTVTMSLTAITLLTT